MKKTLLLLSGFLAFAMSCKKQEIVEDRSATIQKSTKKASSAGDGDLDVLGYGYDILGEYGNSSAATFKVIDVGRLRADYPSRIDLDQSKVQTNLFVTGEDAVSFAKGLSLRTKTTISTSVLPLFKATITANYTDSSRFSSKYIYGNYSRIIKQKRLKINSSISLLKSYLTPEFLSDLQNYSPEYIVSHYGTHVLLDVTLGAKFDVVYRSETTEQDRKTAANVGLDLGVSTVFNLNSGYNSNTTSNQNNFSQTLRYKTVGGNPALSLIGQVTLGSNTAPTLNTDAWQNSSTPQNAELIDIGENGLVLLSDLVDDPAKKSALESYIIQYLQANQIFLTEIVATIQSSNFYNVFLRMDGRYYSPNSSGSGTVNCQYSAGPYEQMVFRKQNDGTYTISSNYFPNLYLRMDGTNVPHNNNSGGGTVNLQNPAGNYERFNINKQSDGTFTISSAYFGSTHLRMDARGVNQYNDNGGGVINCQGLSPGPWEKFIITPALF